MTAEQRQSFEEWVADEDKLKSEAYDQMVLFLRASADALEGICEELRGQRKAESRIIGTLFGKMAIQYRYILEANELFLAGNKDAYARGYDELMQVTEHYVK